MFNIVSLDEILPDQADNYSAYCSDRNCKPNIYRSFLEDSPDFIVPKDDFSVFIVLAGLQILPMREEKSERIGHAEQFVRNCRPETLDVFVFKRLGKVQKLLIHGKGDQMSHPAN